MPEVSIILPVYNEERHLQKTLSTLCTQTFRDFELLAVDDGSTDESRRILERFAAADARITVPKIAEIPGFVLCLHEANRKRFGIYETVFW